MTMPERTSDFGCPYRTASQPAEVVALKKPHFRFGKHTKEALLKVLEPVLAVVVVSAMMVTLGFCVWLFTAHPVALLASLGGMLVVGVITYIVRCMRRDAHEDD